MSTDQIKKTDLELFLEVNRKAIEMETEVASQNEEIISFLSEQKEKSSILENKLDKLIEKTDDLDRSLFKIQVLFITGILGVIVQIVQLFIKK